MEEGGRVNGTIYMGKQPAPSTVEKKEPAAA
jgi:hypothetical protein